MGDHLAWQQTLPLELGFMDKPVGRHLSEHHNANDSLLRIKKIKPLVKVNAKKDPGYNLDEDLAYLL